MKLLIAFLLYLFIMQTAHCKVERIGSKKFLESNVLAELIVVKSPKVQHKANLGGTVILWQALIKDEIQAYPEYTSTLSEVILKSNKSLSWEEIEEKLKEKGIGVTRSLGFSNNYALVLKRNSANKLKIKNISDLNNHNLKLGFSSEFLGRKDGWKDLKEHYSLNLENVLAFEHQLAYLALQNNKIDLTDAYTTDPEIEALSLKVLNDDKNFFPKYEAVYLYRLDSSEELIQTLKSFERKISEKQMRSLNSQAQKFKSASNAAKLFLKKSHSSKTDAYSPVSKRILEHLWLTSISLLLSVCIGFPLGLLAGSSKQFNQTLLSLISVIQTIPSLALLALLIPLLGIGSKTAIFALFLYGLLPIVKNTAAGLNGIPNNLRDQAAALGLPKHVQYQKIFIPLAMPTILAGIKTSAIINIGNATLAALIGAGGLGEPILSGLNLNDVPMILSGAIPAAVLALLTQGLFEILERKFQARS